MIKSLQFVVLFAASLVAGCTNEPVDKKEPTKKKEFTENRLEFIPEGNYPGGVMPLPRSADGRFLPFLVPYYIIDDKSGGYEFVIKLYAFDAEHSRLMEVPDLLCEPDYIEHYNVDLGYWISDTELRVACPYSTNNARAYKTYQVTDQGFTHLPDKDAHHGPFLIDDRPLGLGSIVGTQAFAESIKEVYLTDKSSGKLLYEHVVLFDLICPSHYYYHYGNNGQSIMIYARYQSINDELRTDSPFTCLDEESAYDSWLRAVINIETGKVKYPRQETGE